MSWSAASVANYFLKKANEQGANMTMLKLLKMVYIAHGWSLAALDKGILEQPNEKVEAWQFGPVIPSLYHEFKHFGRDSIEEGFRATKFDFESFDTVEPELGENDTELRMVLDTVWKLYSPMSATKLVNMTHRSNTPWSLVYKDNIRNIEIPDSSIKDHYKITINKLFNESKDSVS